MEKANLTKQIALVTGGAKGYGAGITAALRDAGATVYITGRDQAALDKTAKATGAIPVRADVTSPADWDKLFAKIQRDQDRLDILVNNAGLAVSIKPLADQSDADIIASLAVNLTGAALGSKRAAALMKAQGTGLIVNISSGCQRYAWPGWAVYSAAKAGLAQLAKCLYTELRPHGVRVTTIVPFWGATEFTSTTPDLAGHPAGDPAVRAKCMQPIEMGNVIVHLATLPPHLEVLEYTVLPTVQDIMPL